MKTGKIDQTFLRLLKIDMNKPAGEFEIQVLFSEIRESQFYKPITIGFSSNSTPKVFQVSRHEEEDTEEESDEETGEEESGEEENNSGEDEQEEKEEKEEEKEEETKETEETNDN